jgi:hypothetical protein
MRNMDLALKDTILTITIDLSQDLGPSKSGKSHIVASTDGIVAIPNRAEQLGLNIFRYGPRPT